MSRFLKNWVVSFVVLFVLTLLWHVFVFGDFYNVQLEKIGRMAGGKAAPLPMFLVLGNLLSSLGYAVFVPAVSSRNGRYVLNGLIMALAVTGSFVLFNYGILSGWSGALSMADFFYGIVGGLVVGGLFKVMNKNSVA